MNFYKCYFVTRLGTYQFGREIIEMIIIHSSDILNAAAKCREIIDNNPDRYLFLHDIAELE
jgi:hypothetical protein